MSFVRATCVAVSTVVLASSMVAIEPAVSAALATLPPPDTSAVQVFVGYADNLRPSGFFRFSSAFRGSVDRSLRSESPAV